MQLSVGSTRIEFDWWNPVYAVAPFVLILLSIPLAIFAFVTSVIAGSLLFVRVAIVYAQLVTAIIGAWFDPLEPNSSLSPRRSPKSASPNRHRSHRSSHSNASSVSSLETIVPATKPTRLPNKVASSTALRETGEITRDYEGIGGWRDPGDENEEALWMNMNSRLQLPGDIPTRRHQRSLTGGGSPTQRHTWSPETFRTTAIQSRVKTPVRFMVEDQGDYFPLQPTISLRPSSSASEPTKQRGRRKSGSSSSTSSTTPGLMTIRKERGG